jgi:hypothetical protein
MLLQMQLGNLIVATPSNHSSQHVIDAHANTMRIIRRDFDPWGTGRADTGAATVAAIASMRAGA